MDRRGFLKLAAGGTIGIVASPIIWKTLYDAAYWTQNWGWIPRLKRGENVYVPTVSKLDPTGTGIQVRLVDKRTVRTLGDPENPMSKGALTALAATEAQLLYSEARVKKPLKRSSDGAFVGITWEEAHEIILQKHEEAGNDVAFISGDPNGTINEVFSAFVSKLGSDNFYLMPNDGMTAYNTWQSMGLEDCPGFDIENSDFILSVNANFLESWGTIARNRRIYDATHSVEMDKPKMTLAYASPVQNNTAAGADIWVPIMPTTEIHLLLGIANVLSNIGRVPLGKIANIRTVLSAYTPEKVQALTGLPVKNFHSLVKALTEARKPLIITGSALGTGDCSHTTAAGILLNYLLGRLEQEGNMRSIPTPTKVLADAFDYAKMMGKNLVSYTQGIAKKPTTAPKMLYVYDANPLYALPKNSGITDILEATPFKVALSSFMDETSVECDLILPASMGLERFDDVYTPYGSGFENWTMAIPAALPGYESRPIGDLVLALSKELGNDLGVVDMPALLRAKATAIGADFNQVSSGRAFTKALLKTYIATELNLDFAIMEEAASRPKPINISVVPQVLIGMGSATCAIPPFSTKIITDYQLKGMYSVAQMNGQTAKSLGVSEGQKIKLSNENAVVDVLVSIFEGITHQTISLCTNLGHTAFDQFSKNKGINYINLTNVSIEASTGLPMWNRCSVSVTKG